MTITKNNAEYFELIQLQRILNEVILVTDALPKKCERKTISLTIEELYASPHVRFINLDIYVQQNYDPPLIKLSTSDNRLEVKILCVIHFCCLSCMHLSHFFNFYVKCALYKLIRTYMRL